MSDLIYQQSTLSAGVIREALITIIEQENIVVRTTLRRSVYFLYDYYLRLKLTYKLLNLYSERYNAPVCEVRGNTYYLPSKLAAIDINRTPIHIAATAWLSFDNFRWSKDEYPGVPEDLSYGLVLQYPEPILVATAYLAGLSRADEELSMSELHSAHEYALDQTKLHFPELSRDEILHDVNTRHLLVNGAVSN